MRGARDARAGAVSHGGWLLSRGVGVLLLGGGGSGIGSGSGSGSSKGRRSGHERMDALVDLDPTIDGVPIVMIRSSSSTRSTTTRVMIMMIFVIVWRIGHNVRPKSH